MAETSRPPAPSNALARQEHLSSPSWARQLKQFGLFAAGAGFLAASVAVSRRAVIRRQVDSFPKFYSSNRAKIKFDSSDRSLLALQAFSLATLNVMSFGIMLVGGVSWGFDLSSLSELRERTRAALRRPGLVNPEDEEQMEQMMSDILARLGMEKPEKPDGLEKEQGSDKTEATKGTTVETPSKS